MLVCPLAGWGHDQADSLQSGFVVVPPPTPSLARADGSLSSRFVALRISAALVTSPEQQAQRGDLWSPGRRMFGGTRRARMTSERGSAIGERPVDGGVLWAAKFD
jgi:hypothetical protein